MNSCSFVGRFVRDPELLTVNGTHVVKFTLAINEYRRSKDGNKTKQVDYLDFEAWDSGATTIAKYCNKGDELAVSASARQHRWDEEDGSKCSRIKFRVNSFNLFSNRDRFNREEELVGASAESGENE
jgi:single-strand DNA-binding protein